MQTLQQLDTGEGGGQGGGGGGRGVGGCFLISVLQALQAASDLRSAIADRMLRERRAGHSARTATLSSARGRQPTLLPQPTHSRRNAERTHRGGGMHARGWAQGAASVGSSSRQVLAWLIGCSLMVVTLPVSSVPWWSDPVMCGNGTCRSWEGSPRRTRMRKLHRQASVSPPLIAWGDLYVHDKLKLRTLGRVYAHAHSRVSTLQVGNRHTNSQADEPDLPWCPPGAGKPPIQVHRACKLPRLHIDAHDARWTCPIMPDKVSDAGN